MPRASKHRNANTHHWVGEAPDLENYFGFIYLVECLSTSKKYIGRKQYFSAKRGSPKSRSPNIKSPKWNKDHWVESDWKTYQSSSRSLKEYIKEKGSSDFKFTILLQCESRGALHYAEIKEQVTRGVLTEQDGEGEYIYFNRQIAAIRFRPPQFFSKESRQKISDHHRCRDHTVHLFYKITGEAFLGERRDFERYSSLNNGSISALIAGEVYDKNFKKTYLVNARGGWFYGGLKPKGATKL